MYSFLKIWMVWVILVSCSQSQPGPEASTQSRQVPLPGQSHLLQIFILIEETGVGIAKNWGYPDTQHLGNALNARITFERVKTIENAKEILQQWNARPKDVLILGEGLPQLAWNQLTLAKQGKLKIIALNPEEKAKRNDWESYQVDQATIERLATKFCQLYKNCRVEPKEIFDRKGNSKEGPLLLIGQHRNFLHAGGRDPVSLSVRVNWAALLEEALRSSVSSLQRVDFKSGYLEIKIGENIEANEKIRLDEMVKEFKLGEL